MLNTIHPYLELLRKPTRLFGRPKKKDHLYALEQIGELGNAYDAQYIFYYSLSSDASISHKAAATIKKLLTKEYLKNHWTHLYESFRYPDYNNKLLTPNDLKKFECFPMDEAVHLYGMASLNHNGYVREAALDCLKLLHSSEIFPYVMLRLNDWVPQVQQKARAILLNILPGLPLEDLLKYYHLIEWLEKTGRIKLVDIQKNILERIQLSKNRDELFTAMKNAHFKKRLFCWKLLVHDFDKDESLVDKALQDPAPEIRQLVACHLPINDKSEERLNSLLSDKAIRVRYAMLRAIPKEMRHTYISIFEEAIFDSSRPIREYARFVLGTLGVNGLSESYRLKLSYSNDNPQVGWILGLAETGQKEDLILIQSFWDHSHPKIKAAALAALGKLDAERYEAYFILGLHHNNGKVRKAAVTILQYRLKYLRQELEELLKNGTPKTQIAALNVLAHYGALESLNNILFALTQTDQQLKQAAWKRLNLWHQHYATKLWFDYSKRDYENVVKLFENLSQQCNTVPNHAYYAWKDLPHLLRVLKK